MSNCSWQFFRLWNTSLDKGDERTMEPRNHLWASELGGSMIDNFLKMKGTPPSNPPNPRSLRKFEAGNIWESIVKFVLIRAGILVESQTHLSFQYPGLREVTGRLDFVAGGQPDYDKSSEIIEKEFSWLPPFLSRAGLDIVNGLKEQYPDGLRNIVLEVKSCSSYMYERAEKTGLPQAHHGLQIYHYLKAQEEINEGHIVYICRDDARLIELGIFNPSPIEDEYKKYITDMTGYLDADQMPPRDKPLIFAEDEGKFRANWRVQYSKYLSFLYNIENQFAFEEIYKSKVAAWNRVLTRIKKGDKMTDNNKEKLDEIRRAGFDINEIERIVKQSPDIPDEEE